MSSGSASPDMADPATTVPDSLGRFASLRAATSELISRVAALGVALVDGTSIEGEGSVSRLDGMQAEFWSKQKTISERHDSMNMTVAVLALAKSGKSTLINALVGAHVLPTNNVPETARLCRLTHDPRRKEPVLYGDGTGDIVGAAAAGNVVGESAIRSHLARLNNEVRSSRSSVAGDRRVMNIDLAMAALEQGTATDTGSGVSFSLLDTPGPNEAGEELRPIIENLVDSTLDCLLYVLDYTKLKTNEEAQLFEQLKKCNPQLMQRLSSRLFFVVNKADVKHMCDGLDEASTQEYVAALLNQQMALHDFRLEGSQVLCISARDALLGRLVLNRPAAMDPDQLVAFKQVAFGRNGHKKKVSEEQMREAAEELLEASQVPQLEARVLRFLASNAASIKLTAILDDVTHLLHLVANGLTAGIAALETTVAQQQEQLDSMQTKLASSLARFDEVLEMCSSMEAEVVDEVRARLGFLKDNLTAQVRQVLHEMPSSSPSGRWRRVSSLARTLLLQQQAGPTSSELLQQRLKELHAGIFESIDEEVRGFWGQLEASTHGRQLVLLRCLNEHLAGLSSQIEAAVTERLAVQLQPVTIRLTPPSITNFHDTLAQLFSAGVGTRTVTRQRQRSVTNTTWERRYRNGLCRTGIYFVGVPCHEMMTEDYEETVYETDLEKVRDVLTRLISEVIDESIRATRAIVRQHLAETVTKGQQLIAQYASRYTDTLIAALETCKQGEAARVGALHAAQTQHSTVQELLIAADALRRRAQQLCSAAVADADSGMAKDVMRDSSELFDASSLGGSFGSLGDAVHVSVAPGLQEAADVADLLDATPAGSLLAAPYARGSEQPPESVLLPALLEPAPQPAPAGADAGAEVDVASARQQLVEDQEAEPAQHTASAPVRIAILVPDAAQSEPPPPEFSAASETSPDDGPGLEELDISSAPASPAHHGGSGDEWLVVDAADDEDDKDLPALH